ncbi:MAG: lipoprotein [Pseudomonadales bacterium]|nr:lipoprotein [Pseudomonadales bacterium]
MTKILTIAIFALLTLSACGQKGDLYLPQSSDSSEYHNNQ